MDLYESNVKPAFDVIRDFLLSGGAEKDLPARLGISPATFRRYRRDHQELTDLLAECRQQASQLADDEVEAALFRRATGYDIDDGEKSRHVPPDVKAAVFWLKNRRPESWRDSREVAIGNPIKIELAPEEKEV